MSRITLAQPQLLVVDPASVTFSNSAADQTVWSYTVPGRLLGAGGVLRCHVAAEYLNNSGGSRSLLVRWRFGGVVLWEDTLASLAASATLRPHSYDVYLGNQSGEASQCFGGDMSQNVGTGTTTGFGDFGSSGTSTPIIGAVSSVDTTSDRALELVVNLSFAHAALSYTRRLVVLEHLRGQA